MSDPSNDSFIESCLGRDWPKPLYPHGGGREWSTSMRDEWKRDQNVDVVLAGALRKAEDERDALRAMLERVHRIIGSDDLAAEVEALLAETGGGAQ